MGDGWRLLFVVLISHLLIEECWSLNAEGRALLEFRARVETDPYDALANWSPSDRNPCTWFGVHCFDGKVEMLDLRELSLGGTLTPELGKLTHLTALVLYKNHFSGVIPKEIGGLTMLELLDLRNNNLSRMVPVEIREMLSLKRLLICDNKFQGSIPLEHGKINMLSELQVDSKLTSGVASRSRCINRKFGDCFWWSSLKQMKAANSFMIPLKGELLNFFGTLPLFMFRKGSSNFHVETCCNNLSSLTKPSIVQNVQHITNPARRRLLQEASNLLAVPVSSSPPEENANIPSIGTGSFPAISNPSTSNANSERSKSPTSSPNSQFTPVPTILPANPTNSIDTVQASGNGSGGKWKYLALPGLALLLTVTVAMLIMCRHQGGSTIGPWRTGLSGQLQKAFVTGVPKLNRSELETACEDFSNIIGTLPDCTVYKGTLSSGVEIAVARTTVASSKYWSKRSELLFRRKIDTFSRVNHKNFVNLLGYCEEEDPFLRVMVFEYAPNGTLFEHLHVKEFEHLDWTARMRIVMGMSYCLQYMHHELTPPVVHPNLQSNAIYLTDDYAAKIAEISFWKEVAAKGKISGDDISEHSEYLASDPESNVYSFGILLLEIISGKVPYSEEQGSLVNWATQYLNERRNLSYLIDPTLKSFKHNELDIVCEVIQDCIHQDPRKRPIMRDITSKLREVIAISPDAASPRLSPLWWAELEILSVEAS